MSLKLTITQSMLLQDLDALNPAGSLGTKFDDTNTIVEENFPNYDSGCNTLNLGEQIIIQPSLFVAHFIMIESRTWLDIELTQPAYTRASVLIPQAIINLTTVERLFIQFGIYSKIVITSAAADNAVKWLVMGEKVLDL